MALHKEAVQRPDITALWARAVCSRTAKALVLLVVAASIFLSAWHPLSIYIEHPVVEYRSVDWEYLDRGLSRIHSFSDTINWWTGTWCGEVPFWRPLTSYAFWGMKLLWPSEYMLPRQIVHIILHLCFVSASGLFLWHLTRRFWLVVVSLLLFAGYRPWPISLAFGGLRPVCELLVDPKNIPDPLAGIAMMISLILLLRGRWTLGLLAAVVSVGFKEIGFTTWPLGLLALAYVHRDKLRSGALHGNLRAALRRNRLPIAAWSLVLLVMVVVHLTSVGLGYRIGNNSLWWWRMLLYLAGPVVSRLFMVDPVPAVVAFLCAVAVVCGRRVRLLPGFGLVLLAFAVGVSIDVLLFDSAWDVSLVQTLMPQCRLGIIIVYVCWLLMAWTARRDWPTAVVGFAMGLISVLPTFMAAQTLGHTQYVPSAFLELTAAVAVCESLRQLFRRFISPRPSQANTPRLIRTAPK